MTTPRPVSRTTLSVLLGLAAAFASATYACSSNNDGTTLHDLGGSDSGAVVSNDSGSGHDSGNGTHADASSQDASQGTQDAQTQDDGSSSDAADESTLLDVSQDHQVFNADGGPADAPVAVWDGA